MASYPGARDFWTVGLEVQGAVAFHLRGWGRASAATHARTGRSKRRGAHETSERASTGARACKNNDTEEKRKRGTNEKHTSGAIFESERLTAAQCGPSSTWCTGARSLLNMDEPHKAKAKVEMSHANQPYRGDVADVKEVLLSGNQRACTALDCMIIDVDRRCARSSQ